MIVINISGGLGNQLFQYALGESYKTMGLEVTYHSSILKGFRSYRLDAMIPNMQLHDVSRTSWLQRLYLNNRRQPGLCKVLRYIYSDILKYAIIENKDIIYGKDLIRKDQFLEGHWQNMKYFEHITTQLQQKICLRSELESDSYRDYLSQINSVGDTSVSIHIRRTDYLNATESFIFNDITKGSYYQDAIDYMNSKVKNIKYFVFSDDIDWCKENLNIENATFIEPKSDMKDYHDFTLIRACKHHINANSTFSWWAAYLGSDESNHVTVPKVWFTEAKRQSRYENGILQPENWVKI